MKSANIFVSEDGKYKLGDLNVSKVLKKGLAYTQTGTPYYASPEVWQDNPYDMKSDMWSLGCVIYEMAALEPPFKASDLQSLYKKVKAGEYRQISTYYSTELAEIIRLLLKVKPKERPDTDALLKNPIFKKKCGFELKSNEL